MNRMAVRADITRQALHQEKGSTRTLRQNVSTHAKRTSKDFVPFLEYSYLFTLLILFTGFLLSGCLRLTTHMAIGRIVALVIRLAGFFVDQFV